MANSRSTSPNLAMAATATSIAAAAESRFVQSMVDPQLLADDQNMTEAKSMEQELGDVVMSDTYYNAGPEQQSPWFDNMYPDPDNLEHNMNSADPPRAGSYPRLATSQAMTTEFSVEHGNGRKATKPKVRGKFDEPRRLEVAGVRTTGACIRCRMLKKPCSVGTPCHTCRNVESARLWTVTCTREKLIEVLQLFSDNVHMKDVLNKSQKMIGVYAFHTAPYQIEASHFPSPTTAYATFKAEEGQLLTQGNIDPGLSGHFSADVFRRLKEDDTSLILAAYVKRMQSYFVEKENSHFTRVTLSTAEQMYSKNQQTLLANALELWATVLVLINADIKWAFFERVNNDSPPGSGPIIGNDRPDVQYLNSQLKSAAEKRAMQLCKEVLVGLEARLAKRDRPFETFLIAMILFNCIENCLWLLKSWEQDGFNTQTNPQTYISQAEHLTQLLKQLFHIRTMTPKVHIRPEDGILVVDGTPDNEAASAYYAELNLNRKY